MAFEFKLPDLGEGITEGEVVKWKVKAGDFVEEHQVVLEIETDKAIVEVPSPKKGKVVRLNKEEGAAVNVGETLLEIDTEAEAGEEKPTAKAEERPPEKEAKEAEREESYSIVGKVPEKPEVMAAPKARLLAKKLNIDISTVTGTGPGGFVKEEDVRAIAGGRAAPIEKERPEAQPPIRPRPEKYGEVERIPFKGVRKSIAKNLLASQRTAAFVTGMEDADVSDLWDLRIRERRAAREKGVHLTFMPFFMKAVQHALVSHPLLNASVDEKREEIIVKKFYNIGVAVTTPDGLMVSVIRDVDKKTILELATELQELSRKARERKITLEELKGSTFTISNYGSFGGTYATPIINSPDVAILGTGKVADRPWVKGGSIVIRKVLPLSMTFDHRVIDGAEAAIFLNKVKSYLEDPGRIFIESA